MPQHRTTHDTQGTTHDTQGAGYVAQRNRGLNILILYLVEKSKYCMGP